MTPADIAREREALNGLMPWHLIDPSGGFRASLAEHIATRVSEAVTEERERCAGICDKWRDPARDEPKGPNYHPEFGDEGLSGEYRAAEAIAAAIRAGGKEGA